MHDCCFCLLVIFVCAFAHLSQQCYQEHMVAVGQSRAGLLQILMSCSVAIFVADLCQKSHSPRALGTNDEYKTDSISNVIDLEH